MTASASQWQRRIRRTEQLAAGGGAAAPLLAFYARVLRGQQALYDGLPGRGGLSGTLTHDAGVVSGVAAALVREVAAHGPPPLVEEAHRLIAGGPPRIREVLVDYYRSPSDRDFFAKAILQPYGERLAHAGIARSDRTGAAADNRCPACGGPPQLSFLEPITAMAGDGGGRSLLCAGCLAAWPFRRVRCASCGEEDERQLAYFHAPDIAHLRVDACQTCHRYIKTVDLTKDGRAVPLVDEVAGAPLDLWIRERGYVKLELNLLGL